jgi:hypothetical protein
MVNQFTIERIGSCACGDLSALHGKLPLRKGNMACGYKFYFTGSTFDFAHNMNIEITDIEFAELIPITPDTPIPTMFVVEMQGSCNKCGFCCGYRNKTLQPYGCSHIITTGNRKGECAIYENLVDWCEEHQESHADCIPPQNMPCKKFNPDCGYSFIVITPGLVITGKEITFLEVANFEGHLIEGSKIRQ